MQNGAKTKKLKKHLVPVSMTPHAQLTNDIRGPGSL
jgi:hypothetical protein